MLGAGCPHAAIETREPMAGAREASAKPQEPNQKTEEEPQREPQPQQEAGAAAEVRRALRQERIAAADELDVTLGDGVVELGGRVPSWEEKARASRAARGVAGVRYVENLLEVSEPEGRRPRRSIEEQVDEEIAEAVRGRLDSIESLDQPPQVEVSGGVVTLRGTMGTAEQKARAVDTASSMLGVVRVDDRLRVDGDSRGRTANGQPEPGEPGERGRESATPDTEAFENALEDAIAQHPLLDLDRLDVDVEPPWVVIFRGTVDDLDAYHALIRTAHRLGARHVVEKELFIGDAPRYRAPREREP